MFSILFDSPFLIVVFVIGAIMFIIAKQEKPEQSRYLNFLLLTLVTFGVILFDNPFKSYLYAGLLFYVYVVYIFIPASLVFAFISIYKSKRHLQYYPSNYSKILKTNAWILMILSIVNLLMLLMQSEIGIIILVSALVLSFNLSLENLKVKECRNYNNKSKKMLLSLTQFQTTVT